MKHYDILGGSPRQFKIRLAVPQHHLLQDCTGNMYKTKHESRHLAVSHQSRGISRLCYAMPTKVSNKMKYSAHH